MKRMNKAISVALCLLITLCSFGFTASAEGEGTPCEHVYSASVVPPTCVNEGYTLHVCSKCSDNYKDTPVAALGHAYGGWVDVTEATCTTEGLSQRTCSRCSGVETKTIPVLGHTDENEDGLCDRCGAPVKIKIIFSPYDWIKSFIRFLRDLFQGIFA